MNSSTTGTLPPQSKWPRRVVTALLLLSALPATAAPIRHWPAPRNPHLQQADFLAPEPPHAAADLLLKKEGEVKADALAAFIDGMIGEDNADSDRALTDYQKVLNLDPGYAELAVKVAFELARRGDTAAGISVLKDSVKAAPKEAPAYLYLAQLYAKYLKKPEQAQKYAQQALELDPSDFASYLTLYEIYVNTGQDKKAVEILERAGRLENDDVQFWLQLGEFYVRVLLKDDGSASADDLKKMNAVYQKALSLSADDPDVLTKIADYYVLSQQVKKAIPLYLKVTDLKRNSPDPTLASVQDKLAKSLRLNGQRDEAIAMLEKLIKENPLRYETYELLGELYEEKGDSDRALNNYRQTLLLDPTQPLNFLHVAELFMRTKKSAQAVEIMQEARQKFPQSPQITYSLAIALMQARHNQEAVATFEEAVQEAGEAGPDLLNAQFYFNYGAAAEQAGLIDKAVALLKKSIELDPGSAAQAYNYLGYMWVDKGQNLEEAGELIKRALNMDPDNAAYLDSLGWWYFKKGDPQKAIEQLQKAASTIKPEDAVVFEHLADAYAKSDNVAQALVYWQRAAALEPDDKDALAKKIENAKQKITAHPAPGATASAP